MAFFPFFSKDVFVFGFTDLETRGFPRTLYDMQCQLSIGIVSKSIQNYWLAFSNSRTVQNDTVHAHPKSRLFREITTLPKHFC